MRVELRQIDVRHLAARPEASAALMLDKLSFTTGEQVAIIGPSGAGKTTLLELIAAALKPRLGEVQLDGQNPWLLPGAAQQRLRGNLFLAPQTPPLPPRQRVVTAVLAGALPSMSLLASLRSLFYPRNISGAYTALEAFDLGEKLFERVDRLSGGERQRVGLARALLTPASLWLVDEPLSSLDPHRAQQALATLTAAAKQSNITLIVTLHQVDAALANFPRIIGLRDGEMAFDLPVAQVTTERLTSLYAQRDGERVMVVEANDPPLPAVAVQCR